jgi:putative ABC transport system permease protein
LLLYAVFRIGQATNNMRWSSVKALEKDQAVSWIVPISLGDSHRGFPVVATTPAYFENFRYGDQRPLTVKEGRPFSGVFEAVIGAEVAERLEYRLGQRVVLRHGAGEIGGNDHADKPFTMVGILARTGTPVDRSVHISLEGMEAIHLDWIVGVPLPGMSVSAEEAARRDLTPKAVTAVWVGLKSRAAVFAVHRRIAEYEPEALMGVLPGVALDELWDALGNAERALLVMSGLVGLVSLAGLVAVVVTALEQRRRELAVLRSIGAGPARVFALLAIEGALLTAAGVVCGVLAWVAVFFFLGSWAEDRYGVALRVSWPTATESALLACVFAAGVVASLVPGWRAYRLSLADGLSPKGQ